MNQNFYIEMEKVPRPTHVEIAKTLNNLSPERFSSFSGEVQAATLGVAKDLIHDHPGAIAEELQRRAQQCQAIYLERFNASTAET